MPHPALASLKQRFGDRIETTQALRDQHGGGDSWHPPAPPDAVFFAETTQDVSDALAICHAQGVPVVGFGHGSSIEGQVQAVRGGLCLDLSRMTRILRVSAGDMDCTVEAGVTRQALNELQDAFRHSCMQLLGAAALVLAASIPSLLRAAECVGWSRHRHA